MPVTRHQEYDKYGNPVPKAQSRYQSSAPLPQVPKVGGGRTRHNEMVGNIEPPATIPQRASNEIPTGQKIAAAAVPATAAVAGIANASRNQAAANKAGIQSRIKPSLRESLKMGGGNAASAKPSFFSRAGPAGTVANAGAKIGGAGLNLLRTGLRTTGVTNAAAQAAQGIYQGVRGYNEGNTEEALKGAGRTAVGVAGVFNPYKRLKTVAQLGAAALTGNDLYNFFGNDAQAAQPEAAPASQPAPKKTPARKPVAKTKPKAKAKPKARARRKAAAPVGTDRDNQMARLRALPYLGNDAPVAPSIAQAVQAPQQQGPQAPNRFVIQPDGTARYAPGQLPAGVPESFQPIHALVGNESYFEEFRPDKRGVAYGGYARAGNPVAEIPGYSDQSIRKRIVDLSSVVPSSGSSSRQVDPKTGREISSSENYRQGAPNLAGMTSLLGDQASAQTAAQRAADADRRQQERLAAQQARTLQTIGAADKRTQAQIAASQSRLQQQIAAQDARREAKTYSYTDPDTGATFNSPNPDAFGMKIPSKDVRDYIAAEQARGNTFTSELEARRVLAGLLWEAKGNRR